MSDAEFTIHMTLV